MSVHTHEHWDASYRDGKAPWDIGRPQPAFARQAAEGELRGAVLDAGCGSGEHALLAASTGLPALGVDLAATAIEQAREKAQARSLDAEFLVADALHLEGLGRSFDTVIDCGLFHTFDAPERRRYLESLASVTAPGAALHILCFADTDPKAVPHPVSRAEIDAAFDAGPWSVASIQPDQIEVTFTADGLPAWLIRASRI